jgi:pSer/pThr/pTyr-binding forkhead associated (FHA) protein
MVLVSGDIQKHEEEHRSKVVLPDRTVRELDGSNKIVVGRLAECEIVLSDPNVSRRHAEIRPAGGPGEYEVVDLGSTNGTKVNGIPLVAPRPLKDGDQITFGATTIGFERS